MTVLPVLRKLMIAAVGKPVGRKANWLENVNVGGGDEKTGKRKCCTAVRSIIRVNTGVMEFGRKLAHILDAAIFVIGRILACFHW